MKKILALAASVLLATSAYAGTVTGPTSSVKGDSAPWSNTTGTTVVDGGGPCNVIAYGADPTGVTDSYTAVNTAWGTAGCHVLYFPPGTYKMGTNITGPGTDGAGWIGAGMYASVVSFTTGTGDAVTNHTAINGPVFRDLTITRSSTATSGCGLQMNVSTEAATIANVRITKQYNGLCLQNVGFGVIRNAKIDHNGNYGVYAAANLGDALQWQIHDVVSENNTSDGFHMVGDSNNATPVGQWSGLSTFSNGGYGIYMSGLAAIRLSDSFFGSDTVNEVAILNSASTTYGHNLTNIYAELSGGYGYLIDTSQKSPFSCVNCSAISNTKSGILLYSNTAGSVLHGGTWQGNGTGNVSGNTYGILVFTSGSASIVGVDATASGTQTFGIVGGTGVSVMSTYASKGTISCAATTCNSAGNYN